MSQRSWIAGLSGHVVAYSGLYNHIQWTLTFRLFSHTHLCSNNSDKLDSETSFSIWNCTDTSKCHIQPSYSDFNLTFSMQPQTWTFHPNPIMLSQMSWIAGLSSLFGHVATYSTYILTFRSQPHTLECSLTFGLSSPTYLCSSKSEKLNSGLFGKQLIQTCTFSSDLSLTFNNKHNIWPSKSHQHVLNKRSWMP